MAAIRSRTARESVADIVRRREMFMPEKRTIEKARKAKRAGRATTTQAGEFVREEIHKIRRGEHGARSPQQVIAIGLSKARRAGVALRPPGKGKAKEQTRRGAEYAYEAGQHKRKTHHRPRVARAVSKVLKHEPQTSASRAALSRHAKSAASRRTAAQRSTTAGKAVATKGAAARSAAARAVARTRANSAVIRKLKSGGYRLYSRKVNPKTGKRRNLGTFETRAEAKKHERAA
jgi:hypothetical protein